MTEKTTYPSRLADRFIVRLPDGMRDRLKEAAAANKRSINAEVVARLEFTFEHGVANRLPESIDIDELAKKVQIGLQDFFMKRGRVPTLLLEDSGPASSNKK